MSLFAELKRRNVIRMAGSCVALARLLNAPLVTRDGRLSKASSLKIKAITQ